MNDYRPALDALRERRKGKPGELPLVTGLVLMVAAPFALVLDRNSQAELAVLKAEGRVAEARIKGKAVRSESYTDRKGRQKTREIFTLDLEHDLNAEIGYADWKAGRPFVRPRYTAVTTTSIDAGASAYEGLASGAVTTVVRNPADYKSMMLTSRLEEETSFMHRLWWYLGSAAAFLSGLALVRVGWRKRFPKH